MKKNTKQTKDDKMKKPKQHPKQKGFRMGLRAKILGISLPITIIMVIAMIAIAYSVSEKDIMKSSQSLLRTSAKDQGLRTFRCSEGSKVVTEEIKRLLCVG